MSVDSVLYLIPVLMIVGGMLAYRWARKKNEGHEEKKKVTRGRIDRFGYCSETPKGWGYWLLKLEGSKSIIKILPHMHTNHSDIALINNGDEVEIEFYENGNELIASKLKNLSLS